MSATPRKPPEVRGSAEPIEAAYRVTPAEIERAVECTGRKYVTDMAALYDRISAELGAVYEGQLAAKDQALAAKDETIAELRRRAEVAEVAEAERDRLAALPPAPPAPVAVEVVEDPPLGAWGRLGRWWRG